MFCIIIMLTIEFEERNYNYSYSYLYYYYICIIICIKGGEIKTSFSKLTKLVKELGISSIYS